MAPTNDDRLPGELRRERRIFRRRGEGERQRLFVGRGVEVLAEPVGDLVRPGGGERDQALHHVRADLVQTELERGHDAEVRPGPAHPPEEVGVLRLAHVEQLAVGRDEIHREEVVDREAEPPLEPAHPAAEREPGHPGVTDDAHGTSEPERLRLTVELAEERSAVHLRRPLLRIDADTPHQGEVDHDAVVAGREAADAVTTRPDRDHEVLLSRETDRTDHVVDVAAAGDDRRVAIDHPVPDDPGRVVVGASRQHDLTAERLAERCERVHAHA